MKELPATLLLRPLNMETLATQLYAEASRGTYEDGAVAALLIVLVGLIPVILLAKLGKTPRWSVPLVRNTPSANMFYYKNSIFFNQLKTLKQKIDF